MPEPVDIIVCDASFIGLAKVLEAPLKLAKPGAKLVALIKPQFEAGREEVGKGGVVRDEAVRRRVCDAAAEWVVSQGWEVIGVIESPITGPEGNVEYLPRRDKDLGGEIGDSSVARGGGLAGKSLFGPRKGRHHMQSENKMFDDMVKMVNGLAGTVAGMGREAEASAREKMREWMAGSDFVGRDEFEAVKAMAAAARDENEALKARVATLEARLGGSPAPKNFDETEAGSQVLSDEEIHEERDDGAPIEILEQYFEARGWACERTAEGEIVASATGSWAQYELRGVWRPEDQVLQFLAFPDIKVAPEKRLAIHEALGLINEQLWLGHFEMWSGSGLVVFRHSTILDARENDGLSLEQAEAIAEAAVEECERFYPVFQFVLWGGKSPGEAIAAALIDTHGEA